MSTASAFVGGVLNSANLNLTPSNQTLYIDLVNNLPFAVTVSPVANNSQLVVYSGVGSTPEEAATKVASQSTSQGTTVQAGQSLLYVFYSTSTTTFNLKYKIVSEGSNSDCVTCTINSLIWNSNFGCQQTDLNITGSSSYTTLDSCVQSGLVPTAASSFVLNIDQTLVYNNGVATT